MPTYLTQLLKRIWLTWVEDQESCRRGKHKVHCHQQGLNQLKNTADDLIFAGDQQAEAIEIRKKWRIHTRINVYIN